MILQLLLALVLCTVTVAAHALGTVLVVMPRSGVWAPKEGALKGSKAVVMLTRLVGGLLILHLVEAGIWAVAFSALGVLPDFEGSLYYSLESYTTVGYGDLAPTASWRLVGPIEAAVGILMLGWSTGIIVAAVTRIYQNRSPK